MKALFLVATMLIGGSQSFAEQPQSTATPKKNLEIKDRIRRIRPDGGLAYDPIPDKDLRWLNDYQQEEKRKSDQAARIANLNKTENWNKSYVQYQADNSNRAKERATFKLAAIGIGIAIGVIRGLFSLFSSTTSS